MTMTVKSIKDDGYERRRGDHRSIAASFNIPIVEKPLELDCYVWREGYERLRGDGTTSYVYHFSVEAKAVTGSVLDVVTFDPYGIPSATSIVESFLAKLQGD